MLAALPLAAAPRAPPFVGLPSPLARCPVRIEAAGAGVGCVDEDDAERAQVRPGDRLRLGDDGRLVRERMAPARLSAWQLPVDLNRASPDELASLDGVGVKLAARIVAARPFAAVDELDKVRGLGRRRLELLRPRLRVGQDELDQ